MPLAAAIHWYKRGEISQEKQPKLLDWIAPISSLLFLGRLQFPEPISDILSHFWVESG
jgi:hypothetical protein